MDEHIRLLVKKSDINVNYVVKFWNERIGNNEELVRVCEQVMEVVGMGERYICVGMSLVCKDILTFLCT